MADIGYLIKYNRVKLTSPLKARIIDQREDLIKEAEERISDYRRQKMDLIDEAQFYGQNVDQASLDILDNSISLMETMIQDYERDIRFTIYKS